MGATGLFAVSGNSDFPRFIYITGCDGTGKTTQARLLIKQLQSMGFKTRHVWLRFPFFLSLPLLAYARVHGYSWYEVIDNIRYGYWDFRHSWVMRNIFPWLLLLDFAIASIRYIYIPLWCGWTVVCERFVLDILVDISIASSMENLQNHYPYKLFLSLIPGTAKIIMLDLDAKYIRSRRKSMQYDLELENRLNAFRKLALSMNLKIISSLADTSLVQREIRETILGSKPT